MPSYNVPFSSQYADIGHHEWRARGCGIASLKMLFDYWHSLDANNKTTSLDELLQSGLSAKAYVEGVGWHHRGLAELGKAFGYGDSYNVDLAPNGPNPKTPEEAWAELAKELESGPVMASVWRHLDPTPSGGHIVLVCGWDGELVAIADPMEMTAAEGVKMMALRSFLHLYKQRHIVVRLASSGR
jgi:hypothetical protein